MSLDPEILAGLGMAMNEARLLGAEVVPDARVAGITLEVLTLPESGDPPADRRVQILLSPVGRAAASLRAGTSDDAEAPVERFDLEGLLNVIESFRGAIHSVDLFDQHEKQLALWGSLLSLDWRSGSDGQSHSIFLQLEGLPIRHLDLCIWFDELAVKDPVGNVIATADFIAGGRRWWEAFRANDPRTSGRGIFRLKKP